MKNDHDPVVILMADDDADDRYFAKDALEEAHVINDLRFVCDGEELMDYLNHTGEYTLPESCPRPGIILLDLNMPRKDGREALQEIKQAQHLRSIPIVVLTTSKSEEDIIRSYQDGVAGYVTKPVSFEGLVQVMKAIGNYWFQIVELPTMED
jgi:CheY-like chemotaxis protein